MLFDDDDEFFVNHAANLPDEKCTSSRSGGMDWGATDAVTAGLRSNDFFESQVGNLDELNSNIEDPDDELSCLNMAQINTEAFAELSSPIMRPIRKSLSLKKRKHDRLGTPKDINPVPKRRQIFKTPVAHSKQRQPQPAEQMFEPETETDFFKTQFLMHVDTLSKIEGGSINFKNKNNNATTAAPTLLPDNNVGLSQFFQASQMEITIRPNSVPPVVPLRLTQMLRDDIGFLDQAEDQQEFERCSSVPEVCPSLIENPRLSNKFILSKGPTQIPNKSSGLTQMLSDGDDLLDQVIVVSPKSIPPPRTPSVFTQLLADDNISLEDLPQCSQRFLNDVIRQVEVIAPQPTDLTTDPVTIYTSVKSEAAYIEMQRKMHTVNEENLDDDNFIDPELSQAYKSTQYRQELENIFNHCEKSICELKNLHTDEAAHGLENVNWSQNDFNFKTPVRDNNNSLVPPHKGSDKTPLTSPTNLIRTRMEERKKVTPPGVSASKQQQKRKSNAGLGWFQGLGPFFGLPLKVKTLIRDFKGISELYDWQKECLTLPAIARRDNLIYALPTSGGKTLVSEILILREVLCRRRNCLFILPYVSIVQEKLWALSPFAVQLDFLLEEYAAGKGSLPPQKRRKKRSIYIATIEKGLALLNSLIEANRANELGMIVVDELHIIGEEGRGAVLETLLTTAMYISAGIQIVGMSATIGNLPELAKFLRADVYTRDFRPVELREFIKCGKDLMQIHSRANSGNLMETFEHVRTVEYNYRDDVERRDPDHLAGLVSEVIPEQSVLIFCPSKANCENVAKLLCQLLPANYREYKTTQRAELKSFMEKEGPLCPILSRSLPYGIAYHHSGLTGDERRHLEDAFRLNIICVICCTSTLAAGVNLPAKRVILRSPYVGRDFITLSRYKQMVGRAGRAGLCGDVGESILICSPKDNVKVGQLLCSPMDEAASRLHDLNGKGIESIIISAIGLGIAVNRTEISALIDTTLMSVQAKRLGINTEQLTNRVLSKLFRLKTLSIKSENGVSPNISFEVELTSQSRVAGESEEASTSDGKRRSKTNVKLKPSTTMQISSMGRASFKSGFDLEKANKIYKILTLGQQSMVLSCYLHLLYVVTPYEPADVTVQPDVNMYYTQYLKLDKYQLQVAKVLGITESVAMRIKAGNSMKTPELQSVVNRFFFTLVLQELWNQRTVYEVADLFNVNRGVVQNLIVASASFASGVLKFCEELEEFWAFRELLRLLTKRLSYCCTVELIPLMDLPCVKLARAKQLYAAGFKTLESIAKADVIQLVDKIEHLTLRVAKQLISSAKVLLLEKVETLREEVQDCLEVLEGKGDK